MFCFGDIGDLGDKGKFLKDVRSVLWLIIFLSSTESNYPISIIEQHLTFCSKDASLKCD